MSRRLGALSIILAVGLASADANSMPEILWIGSWATSPTGVPDSPEPDVGDLPPPLLVKGTLRYRIRLSQGGTRIRLRLSNDYGRRPLAIAAVSVGIAADGLGAVHGSLRPATFAGKSAITIPAGAPAITDPVNLPVAPLSDLVVSVAVSDSLAVGRWSTQPPFSVAIADGDLTLAETFSAEPSADIRPIVSAVDVASGTRRRVVVALGDSITDGSVDPQSGERSWPGALARRLRASDVAVVNAGISGNRLLQSSVFMGKSAASRMDQDVFSVPGLTHLIVLEGINDLGMSSRSAPYANSPALKPADAIAAYTQLAARAHEHQVRIFGATLLPFAGAPYGYYSTEKEVVRLAINEWIRTSTVFDGVIDFDAAMRDPQQPQRLRPKYDSGDHLHPNFAGERRMGELIDVAQFR